MRSFSIILITFMLNLFVKSAFSWFNCKDVEYCTRIRENPANYDFDINLKNAIINKNSVEATVININTGTFFDFTLTALQGGIFRISIDDPNSIRYKVSDALDGDPAKAEISVENHNNDLTVTAGETRAKILSSPFIIQFFRNDEMISVVNNRGLMVFEETEPNISVALDIYFLKAQKAYGLPLHADYLTLRTTSRESGTEPYRFYNIDHGGFETESPQALYGTIPVIYAHSTKSTSGAFWLNSAQTFVEIDNQNEGIDVFFFSESGIIDLFILTGPTLQNSVRQYAKLTGVAPVPQYFTLGYHQSRYSYMSMDDVKEVVNNFDSHNFPLDVMWLDIDYTDSKKYFTWDPERFSDPIGMQEFLNSTGRKLVAILDPHYYVQEGYFVYDEAQAKGYFVKDNQGNSYIGKCWPGQSSWIDYFNPDARDYYASLHSFYRFQGSTDILFVWNDMNEPAVFEGYEGSMPKDNMHFGGWLHRDIHNQYGFYQHMATYKGLIERMNGNQRPFILTRSHFAGSQRYAALWTGDNNSEYKHLKISIPMCLTEALAGMSFCGADIGGFTGNVDENLLQRWTQAAVWLPFFRQHSAIDTPRREPYLYSEKVQARLRYAMRLRYYHLPYWYTIFYEHYRTSDPVIRPITFHYPADENVLDMDTEWLVGENILVCPVTEQDVKQINVYLPGGSDELWYDTENTLVYTGIGDVILNVNMDSNIYFYRGGSIIPRKDTNRPSSEYTHTDPITLYIFLNTKNEATGNFYIDDTRTFDYTRKIYTYLRFTYANGVLSYSEIDLDAGYDNVIIFGTAILYRPPSYRTQVKSAVLRSATRSNNELKITHGPGGVYVRIEDINVNIAEPFSIHLE